MTPVIVFGGYGTFGSHVCRQLAKDGVAVTVAGRDAGRAIAFARELGPACRGVAADAADPASCRVALSGHGVAANCAGPFGQLGDALLNACLDAGCHYADITDNRAYAALVRGLSPRFAERGLAAVYGCSSLPGVSGALGRLAMHGAKETPWAARTTLFIGNNNPKGAAAVDSLLGGLGRPIPAPQGQLRGFRNRAVVPLPPPFGHRGVFNFDSPEYDVFPADFGVGAVAVKVGFEMRLATYAFATLAVTGFAYGPRFRRLIDLPSRALRAFGCSGGAVMTELFFHDGRERRASVATTRDGQLMAAFPCALVALALAGGPARIAGASTAYEFLGHGPLLDGLAAVGFPAVVVEEIGGDLRSGDRL